MTSTVFCLGGMVYSGMRLKEDRSREMVFGGGRRWAKTEFSRTGLLLSSPDI